MSNTITLTLTVPFINSQLDIISYFATRQLSVRYCFLLYHSSMLIWIIFLTVSLVNAQLDIIFYFTTYIAGLWGDIYQKDLFSFPIKLYYAKVNAWPYSWSFTEIVLSKVSLFCFDLIFSVVKWLNSFSQKQFSHLNWNYFFFYLWPELLL